VETFYRIGTDLVHIPRIQALYERFGSQFLSRVYTEAEQRYCLAAKAHLFARLAGRWAAKEAVTKALGTGWRGLGYRDVEVIRQVSGEPSIQLHNRAAAMVASYAQVSWQVSFSHDKDYAISTVLLVGMV
jgi:holo-[acyl-carrier protein] synthase